VLGISEAYQVLGHPDRRKVYDKNRGGYKLSELNDPMAFFGEQFHDNAWATADPDDPADSDDSDDENDQ
jgi:curved DNA-binding protein CbpA